MKKIRGSLKVAAVLLAATGAFASKFFATTYYRAADANFNTPGPDCSVVVTQPCPTGTYRQCSAYFFTQLPGEDEPTLKRYYISKVVDVNPCEIFLRPMPL